MDTGLWVADNSEHVYRARPLGQFDWLEHWFGTRHATFPGPDANIASLHQVHSDICLVASSDRGRIGDGDALLSDNPGQLVGIRTADCLPILIADERLRAVAAVHAGWKGTVLGIAVAATREMGRLYSSRPEDLHVAIGPRIGACCYEVGPEVASQFQPLFPEKELAGHTKVDLAEANRRQLVAAGIRSERIYSGAPCTFCAPQEFYSYRREKDKAGRMLSGIGIRAR